MLGFTLLFMGVESGRESNISVMAIKIAPSFFLDVEKMDKLESKDYQQSIIDSFKMVPMIENKSSIIGIWLEKEQGKFKMTRVEFLSHNTENAVFRDIEGKLLKEKVSICEATTNYLTGIEGNLMIPFIVTYMKTIKETAIFKLIPTELYKTSEESNTTARSSTDPAPGATAEVVAGSSTEQAQAVEALPTKPQEMQREATEEFASEKEQSNREVAEATKPAEPVAEVTARKRIILDPKIFKAIREEAIKMTKAKPKSKQGNRGSQRG